MNLNERPVQRLAFKRRMKDKFKAWTKRFLLAEICGASLAIAASYLAIHFFHNAVIAAYAGAVGDTIGFYTPIFLQDTLALRKILPAENRKFTWRSVLYLIKNMLLEFGPAEVLDSLFLRPFFMYYFPILLHNYPLGVLVGKLVGDVAFYIPVTLSNRLKVLYKRNKV